MPIKPAQRPAAAYGRRGGVRRRLRRLQQGFEKADHPTLNAPRGGLGQPQGRILTCWCVYTNVYATDFSGRPMWSYSHGAAPVVALSARKADRREQRLFEIEIHRRGEAERY